MKYLICLFLFTTLALNDQENESRREFVQEGESVKFTEYHVNGKAKSFHELILNSIFSILDFETYQIEKTFVCYLYKKNHLLY